MIILGVNIIIFITFNPFVGVPVISAFFSGLPVLAWIVKRMAGQVIRLGFSPGVIIAVVLGAGGSKVEAGPLDAGRKAEVYGLRNDFRLILDGNLAAGGIAAVKRFDRNYGVADGYGSNCAVLRYRGYTRIARLPLDS